MPCLVPPILFPALMDSAFGGWFCFIIHRFYTLPMIITPLLPPPLPSPGKEE